MLQGSGAVFGTGYAQQWTNKLLWGSVYSPLLVECGEVNLLLRVCRRPNVSLGLYMYMYMHIVVVVEYRMFSNVLAEQKAVQSRQLGICGSQLETQQKFRKLRLLIRVHDETIGNKMVEFSLVVEAPVRGYHAYLDQWEAAINTSLFFEVSMTLMKGL